MFKQVDALQHRNRSPRCGLSVESGCVYCQDKNSNVFMENVHSYFRHSILKLKIRLRQGQVRFAYGLRPPLTDLEFIVLTIVTKNTRKNMLLGTPD